MKALSAQSPMSVGTYFQISFNLVHQYYTHLISFSLLHGVYYFGLCAISQLASKHGPSPFVMVGWVLWLPLIASYLGYFEKLISKQPTSFIQGLLCGFNRLLPAFGSLLGVLLVPSIVLAIGFVLYGLLTKYHLSQFEIPLFAIIMIAIVALLNSRFNSFTLTLMTEDDSNSAAFQASNIIKGHWLSTLMRATLPWFIVINIFCLPLLIQGSLPNVPPLVVTGATAFLIMLLTPYLWSLIVVHTHDLAQSYTKAKPTPMQPPIKKLASEIAQQEKSKDQEWF